jgi:hypothetical protein
MEIGIGYSDDNNIFAFHFFKDEYEETAPFISDPIGLCDKGTRDGYY